MNVTNQQPLLNQVKQLIVNTALKKTDGQFLKEYDGRSIQQEINGFKVAPFMPGKKIELYEISNLLKDDNLDWRDATPTSGKIKTVFLEVNGSLIAFDTSDQPTAQMRPDLIGDGRAGRFNFFNNQLEISLDTVDYFGNRPEWLRAFDQVERPILKLALEFDIGVGPEGNGPVLRATSGTAKLDCGTSNGLSGESFIELWNTFDGKIEFKGFMLDLIFQHRRK